MSPFSATSRFLAVSVSAASAIYQGPLKIDSHGQTLELHVVASSEKGKIFRTSDRTLTMKWGNQTRGFLAERETDDMSPDMFFNFTLLNTEFSYDVDLSQVGCSCNAALFFASMPGRSANGSIARGVRENPFYCDANRIGGVWCWEHDTIEANMYNTATTPHTCDSAPGQYIDKCDMVGCASSAFQKNQHGMCPEDTCIIDTRKPFRVHQSFVGDAKGKLIRIINRFTQPGRTFSWEVCGLSDYLAQMSAAIGGKMSMVFQLWGDSWENMKWLDKMTGCSGACIAEKTEVSFSNIAIKPIQSELFVEGGEEMIV